METSAAFPLVSTPIVLTANQGACQCKEPDWLTAHVVTPRRRRQCAPMPVALCAGLGGRAAAARVDRGWDCKEVKRFVGEASFAILPDGMRDALDEVPTPLKLETAQVDMVIEAGRLATRMTPAFNGFLASLAGNDAESRMQDGIAAGGRRVAPLGT